MAYLFTLLLVIAFLGTIFFLIKPSLIQNKFKADLSRVKIFFYGLTLNFVLFVLVGVFAPEVETKDAHPAAPNAEKQEQSVTTEKKAQPIKAEANLGMTPEEFRQKFNAKLRELDIDSIRPVAEFDIQTGSVRDTFQVSFTNDVAMLGTVNKDGNLREITYIVGGTQDYKTAMMNLIILAGVTAKVVSPNSDAENELVLLINEALKNLGKENNNQNKIIGGVKYYAMANEVTGLWVGISPAKD